MKLAYTILYVQDVHTSVAFYRDAFGLEVGFVHESGDYAQMETGSTSLAFSSHKLMTELQKNPSRPDPAHPCSEIAFTTPDVAAALKQALAAGAKVVQEPEEMPWGQTVAYVSDPDGFLVEICTPIQLQA